MATNTSGNPPRPSPWRFILDNTAWLLGSLLLAVFVWFAAVNQQNPVEQQRFRDRIPIQVLKDETLLIVNQPPPAQVVVRAPRTVWDILDANDITITADLRGKPAGKYVVSLVPSLSPSRQGVVSEVQPSQVTIELAKRSEQVFNITIEPIQQPPVGFFVDSTTPSETTARVSGSEAQVKQVVAVLARVNLADQDKSVTRTIPLEAVDAEKKPVPDVSIIPQQITTTIAIKPRPGVTVMKVSAVLQTNTLPQGYLLTNYEASPATVAVRGDPATIAAMNGRVNTDPLDLTAKTAPFTQAVKLALPPGVSLTDPVDVSVNVQIEAITVTREFPNIPVITQGLDPADFSITLQPKEVNVIVKGPQQAVNALQANEITVIAPLAGLGGGTHTVTLQASVAHAGLQNSNLSIPNPQAQVTIVALRPTLTPTATRIPTQTPVATASATP